MNATSIEWSDRVWNPVTGCSKVSEGCRNCYAERISLRFKRSVGPWSAANAAKNVILHPERLALPLSWKKPAKVFVNSMSDLFHERVPDEFIDQVFAVMAATPQHAYQVLTKRPERMREYVTGLAPDGHLRANLLGMDGALNRAFDHCLDGWHQFNIGYKGWPWPLPNVWLGTSTEDQRTADERIPHLLNTPAAVRFLSMEPLLGPVRLGSWEPEGCYIDWLRGFDGGEPHVPGLDWIIVGGESGSGARPMDLDWARAIRDQCVAAGVPFFFKQVGHRAQGRELDGREWSEFPRVAGVSTCES